MTPSDLELLLRLLAAALFGGLVGLEREMKSKPAGLRTHMMVSIGAACFTLTAFAVATETFHESDRVRIDPVRIVEGVVGGIGFLGAGAILRDRGSVTGLTTAGGLWLVGAVGVAAGTGEYVLALSATLLSVVVLHVLGRFENGWIQDRLPSEGQEERGRDGT